MTDRYTDSLARDDAPLLWFWLAYDPAYETTAEYQLQDRAGCETYLPRGLTPSGRIEPLFPFYMAIGTQEPQWALIKTCIGVEGVLKGASTYPIGLPSEHIDEIKAREDGEPVKLASGTWVRLIRLHGPPPTDLPTFEPGDLAEVRDGAWIGHTGVFSELDGKQRAWLLVEMFGRWTRVAVKREHLAKAGAAADAENGRRGGRASAANMTVQQRRERARKAARSRWATTGG